MVREMEGDPPTHDASEASAEMFVSASISPSSRLPMPPTPFIGRERQVADVCTLLGRATVRLLTLTGPGGIGKTRLVLAAAEALRGEFPAGIFYISLAPLSDARLVMPAIAQALGVREAGGPAQQPRLLERVQDYIGEQRLLVVLDNYEQVIGAAAGVAELLNACPRLKVMVTSREMLHLSAEHCYPVPPLSLPDLQHLPPLEFLAQVEALRLFVTRAQAVQPDFALTSANGIAVAAICHRLDGLPLAIELAAARVRLLPPAAMLARLERRLPWLTGGAKDAPARHRTLRAAIGWSYDLLEPHEQRLFRRMSVFVGGCTLESVAAVCDSTQGEEDLLQVLASLLDKSLLRNEGAQGVSARAEQGRLYMLETIREYALDQLAASSEEEATRRRHASYYLALAEEAEPKMNGPDQPAWLVHLEQEHDNLRAALAWSVSGGDVEMGARIAAALWLFWLTHGHIREGRRWLNAVLAHSSSLPPAIRARALNGAGRLALRQGDYASAQAVLEESLTLWRGVADIKGEMQALNNLALVAIYQDALVRAQNYCEQSLAGYRLIDDKLGRAQALIRLGLALRYQGYFERAAECYEECLALARELNDTYLTAGALHNLGQMAHHRGDDVRAHHLLVESLLLVRQLDDTPNISVWLADLAGVWATQGQPERAARLFGAADLLRENMQVIMYEAQHRAYQRDVERAAAQLDAATWQAAWAEGRTMSLDETCALASEELPTQTAEASGPPTPRDAFDLSERELEVLRLLVVGLTYAEIGKHLTLSFHTVHAHLRSIYSKLGVTSRSQATRFATEHNLA
jgi:predicted ATPase/DNA-binding CsgD family transcriptional regulator